MQCVFCTQYSVHCTMYNVHLFCRHILYIPKYTILSMCTIQKTLLIFHVTREVSPDFYVSHNF